jgi:hypothetical protein
MPLNPRLAPLFLVLKRFSPRSNYVRETVKKIHAWQRNRATYLCILCWYIQTVAVGSFVRSVKRLNKWTKLTCGL